MNRCVIRLAAIAIPSLWTALLLSAEVPGISMQGQWQQGGLLHGQVEPGAEVKFSGRQVRTTDKGAFIIGLGRDAPAEALIQVTLPTGKTIERRYAVKRRQYPTQRIDGVPPRTVNPPASALKRIREESAQARRAKQIDSPRQDFLNTFTWPLLGPITGVYGSRRVYNGKPKRPHYGLDIAAPTGTVVRAPVSGAVTLAHDNMYFSGGTLAIDHGHGLSSFFIHLSKILVRTGDIVEQGQPIAEVGATGRATGPHLDWRINWFEHRLDPALLVGEMPVSKTDPKPH